MLDWVAWGWGIENNQVEIIQMQLITTWAHIIKL